MTKLFICLSIIGLFHSMAEANCFLAKQDRKVLREEGDCTIRYNPESSFKIPLSLIGFDSEILQDETNPNWPPKEGDDFYANVCKGVHNPRTWIRDSCLWYSRILTVELGLEKLKDYVQKFSYGNAEITGNNALSHSWISSGSLQISANEQTEFMQRLIDHELPISPHAYEMGKKILFIQELSGGWKLYGKTGNGKRLDHKGCQTELQHGWFVGWIEKADRAITFACHITDDKKENSFASFRARNETLIKLWHLIDDLENK